MREEDCCLLIFVWFFPNAVISLLLGFSEQYGYNLGDCTPGIADWLRYGFMQYQLLAFGIAYGIMLPRKYSIYFDRFLNQGHVSFALAWVFAITQCITPWITLALYIKLRSNCSHKITTGQSVYYWILFSLQVLASFVFWLTIYFFWKELFTRIMPNNRRRERFRKFLYEGAAALSTGIDLRKSYVRLLSQYYPGRSVVTFVDLQVFYRLLSKHLDSESLKCLQDQKRICYKCREGFQIADRVLATEQCRHIAHWECFRSVLSSRNTCPECNISVANELKKRLEQEDTLAPIIELVRVPPCIKPIPAEMKKNMPPNPANQPTQPIVTIEYFNYTVDQKTGGEPAEALPAPVAETEI